VGGSRGRGPLKPLLKKAGWIGAKLSDYLAATYFGHFVVHHVKTSNRNYTTQFDPESPGDRSTIDAELDALGEVGRSIKKSDYGMSLTHAGITAGVLVTLPVYMTLVGSWIFSLVGALADDRPCPRRHQHLHLVSTIRQEAMARSGPLCACCWERYMRNGFRDHWIHHKGGGSNPNLVPVPMFSSAISRSQRIGSPHAGRRSVGAVWSSAGIRTGAAGERRSGQTGPEALSPR
jgi:hypothetical protein